MTPPAKRMLSVSPDAQVFCDVSIAFRNEPRASATGVGLEPIGIPSCGCVVTDGIALEAKLVTGVR